MSASSEENDRPKDLKEGAKPQATFLTKLYALLERKENHHMIRWDEAGEHIIVERPEQLALHVLPSIYRQSRFASFSRQLNIYGFMRKVNLRNVDPAIDDPDASTWSHPTLNRHSPPEVVANFKRRVPPRLPKPRKRDQQELHNIPPPRSAIGMGPAPPSLPMLPQKNMHGRPRGFSSPGSFHLNPNAHGSWDHPYRGTHLPPLTVPQSSYPIQQADHSPIYPSSQYYDNPSTATPWNQSYNTSASSSLSSLLNPSYPASRPNPTINTSYFPIDQHASAPASMSPDSRPPTGYGMSSSLASLSSGYASSRPGSSQRRLSPESPSHSRERRQRSHSHAMHPYPTPYADAQRPSTGSYDHRPSTSPMYDAPRPSTSPAPMDQYDDSRGRGMIQLPSLPAATRGAMMDLPPVRSTEARSQLHPPRISSTGRLDSFSRVEPLSSLSRMDGLHVSNRGDYAYGSAGADFAYSAPSGGHDIAQPDFAFNALDTTPPTSSAGYTQGPTVSSNSAHTPSYSTPNSSGPYTPNGYDSTTYQSNSGYPTHPPSSATSYDPPHSSHGYESHGSAYTDGYHAPGSSGGYTPNPGTYQNSAAAAAYDPPHSSGGFDSNTSGFASRPGTAETGVNGRLSPEFGFSVPIS
ncbi:HSF-type DNA-binding-domain-containing protein [Schizophyllum amplum]|uniref:HSF-type DNA-binding-domain-containing protein n=1 Tax=Schizophyllum amplum TaxID=97359 RepID=A0A550CU01_9AGAR|nr:HSF-type DNA-binding-domain-containing protein [Auriculariopsis ampla]